MVADGDVKGVTACDVVSQWLPVHCDQPGPGLSDLQPLWSPHWFCREAERCKGKAWSSGLRRIKVHQRASSFTPISQMQHLILASLSIVPLSEELSTQSTLTGRGFTLNGSLHRINSASTQHTGSYSHPLLSHTTFQPHFILHAYQF